MTVHSANTICHSLPDTLPRKTKVTAFMVKMEICPVHWNNAGQCKSSNLKASSSLNELALVSLFGRVMYSFDDRYLFSASIRRDGSSRFRSGHQYGAFPSASIGWNINREKFFKPLENVFDQLKLRFSYGKLGNRRWPATIRHKV